MARYNRSVIKGFRHGWISNVDVLLKTSEYRGGALLLDSSWLDCKNVQIDPIGTFRKRRGTSAKNSTAISANPPVMGIYQYYTPARTSHLLVYTPKVAGPNGASAQMRTWNDSTNVFTTRTGSVTFWVGDIDNRPVFVHHAGAVVVTNGNENDQPCYWLGTSNFTEMPSMCPPCKYMASFKGYLFAVHTYEGSKWRPDRIKWSKAGSGIDYSSDWPTTSTMDLDANDGDRITGVAQLGDQLIVFKEKKIFAVHYLGGKWEFDYTLLHVGHGCIAGGSIIPVKGGLVYLSLDGFYLFTGSGEPKNITEQIRDKVFDISYDYAKHVVGVNVEKTGQIWWTVPYDGADTISASAPTDARPCNEVWVWDYDQDYWTRYDLYLCTLSSWFSQFDLTIGDLDQPTDSYYEKWDDRSGLAGTALPLGGDYRGFFHSLDTGARDASSSRAMSTGTNIDAWMKTRWIDLGDPTVTKRLYRTNVLATQMGSATIYNLYVKIRTDWNDDASGTLKTVPLSLPIRSAREERIDWTKHFRAIQLQVGTSAAGEDFEVHSIELETKTKGRTGYPHYG